MKPMILIASTTKIYTTIKQAVKNVLKDLQEQC